MELRSETCDVCVVGAGPAGIVLSALLARFGVKIIVVDDRADQTAVGRADGLQPKTIETLLMLRLGQDLLDKGVRVFDICMWRSENSSSGQAALRRVGREVHYPAGAVDLLHPFILLCHQGMVEGVFVEDLRQSGFEVQRGSTFERFNYEASGGQEETLTAVYKKVDGQEAAIKTNYLVGCDGARSRVRQGIPGTFAEGNSQDSYWGVLDGELDTDFPDLWSKTVIYSEEHGSVLIIPRERNLTRFYIEIKGQQQSVDETFVMEQARKIMNPFHLEWLTIEWFGNYRVTQRVAAKFSDAPESVACHPQVFIAGDASHTHSPKAAQGMNTSIHDSWNLGWKLNLSIRGLAKKDTLLRTYEEERKKIAHDLINFDYEHANSIAAGDARALAENFRTNVGFISGVGAEYEENVLNLVDAVPSGGLQDCHALKGEARVGRNLPPAKVTRYIDDNPVDIQLDIPILGQFRVFILADVIKASGFLRGFSDNVLSPSSLISQLSLAANESYSQRPRPSRADNTYYRPERYIPWSNLFTFSLITSTAKCDFELASLPPLLSTSKWTVYLDNIAAHDTRGQHCAQKWMGSMATEEVVLLNVRPDGYIGSVKKFDIIDEGAASKAAEWLDEYYDGFLQVTKD
ncbi:hypothetical protein N0V93_004583 [Gnomoniopsis smithogilvyi]|uniref:FAD binding domain-containing protein n=1 Tax=Gnomoniopsis smithogilvyi TaxID=1191159 RepID=A0A9W8YRR6_9PEZI|nr:hypothetical protein N0V93_004583 [Gnomoniopsis smithogilvyi]